MTAVYYGRREKMEGYEIYRLSDEEIQHVGVKGMKWGKRKSRSAYMTAVDKHEAKTSARRDAKKAASKAKYEQEKSDFKQVKKQISDSVKTSKLKENYTKSIEADKATVKNVSDKVLGKKLSDRNATYLKNASKNRKPKVKLSKDEKDAIAEEKFWAKDAKDKARVERNKARMAKVMGQKAVDVLTAPENRVKIAAVTSVIAAYAGTQMGSSKNARLMREFNSHNYKI